MEVKLLLPQTVRGDPGQVLSRTSRRSASDVASDTPGTPLERCRVEDRGLFMITTTPAPLLALAGLIPIGIGQSLPSPFALECRGRLLVCSCIVDPPSAIPS